MGWRKQKFEFDISYFSTRPSLIVMRRRRRPLYIARKKNKKTINQQKPVCKVEEAWD
jgi:hypothetical protein